MRRAATLLVLLVAACADPAPAAREHVVSDAVPAEARDEIAAVLAERFGTPDAPLPVFGASGAEELRAAAAAWRTSCALCHGTSGEGAGDAAPFLTLAPPDLREGTFKYTSTESGAPPTRDDVIGTLRHGIERTGMPAFAALGEGLGPLADLSRLLAARGEAESALGALWEGDGALDPADAAAEVDDVVDRWRGAADRVFLPASPPPAADPGAIARGAALWEDELLGCAICHGADGAGDGRLISRDRTGRRLPPPDLTQGELRGGDDAVDVYRRIAVGVKGGPMTGYADRLDEAQIWDLVHFVQSLDRTRR